MAIAAAAAVVTTVISAAVGGYAIYHSYSNRNPKEITSKFRWIRVKVTNETSYRVRYAGDSEKCFDWGTKFFKVPVLDAANNHHTFEVCNWSCLPRRVSGKVVFEIDETIPILIDFCNPLVGSTTILGLRGQTEVEHPHGFKVTYSADGNDAVVAITKSKKNERMKTDSADFEDPVTPTSGDPQAAITRSSLQVKEVMREIAQVHEWLLLGVELDIPVERLEEIKRNYPGDVAACKLLAVDHWLKNDTKASWSGLLDALEHIGHVEAAGRVRQRYGLQHGSDHASREEPRPPKHEPRPPTLELSPPTHEPRPPTLELSPPTHELSPPTLEPRPPTLELSPPTLEPRPPTLEPRPPTHEPRPPTLELRPPKPELRPPKLEPRPPKLEPRPPKPEPRPPKPEPRPPKPELRPPKPEPNRKMVMPDSGSPPSPEKERSDQPTAQPMVKKSIKLRWQRMGQAKVNNEVIAMERGAVAVNGSTAFFGRSENVYGFNYDEKRWFSLPDVPKRSFRLVVVKDFLTAVGGFVNDVATGTLLGLDESSGKQEWIEVFPPMPTARGRPAVVCTGHSLVAAGGSIKTPKSLPLNTVEVMDTESLQWFAATSLPQPVTDMTITVCDEKLFLLGGRVGTESSTDGRMTRMVYSASLLQTSKLSEWKELEGIPSYYSSCAFICGQLLGVGGCDKTRSTPTKAIYQYDPTANAWNVVSHMLTARYLSFVAVLPNDKLLVVGGSIEAHFWIATVEVASVSLL